MASRDIGGSIQAALRDLLEERAVVEDAIEKLQSLLATMKVGTGAKRRGRPPGSVNKKSGSASKAGRKPARRGRKPGKAASRVGEDGPKLTKAGKRRGRPPGSGKKKAKTGRKGWSPEARERARERMQKYWAKQRGEG